MILYFSLYIHVGVCQCPTYQFYNGSASLGNGICVPLHLYNESCSSISQCDYRVNLVCSSNLCLCGAGKNYDPTVNSGGVMGYCVPAAGYLDNCSNSILCSTSQNLYCDFSYYGGASTIGVCLCNTSWLYWDGTTCTSKLSIGGECTNNIQCIAAEGLFCSNYTPSVGTCDCDQYHFWNDTCIIKQWFNTSLYNILWFVMIIVVYNVKVSVEVCLKNVIVIMRVIFGIHCM